MERIIQQTDYDAFSSKLCAIEKKYLPPARDALINSTTVFNNNEQVQSLYQHMGPLHIDYFQTLKGESRNVYGKMNKLIKNPFPVMNYGTYLRTLAIDTSILNYINTLEPDEPFQIINLGCGSDLRFIQYLNNFKQSSKFIDLDFDDAIRLKRKVLDNSKNLGPIVESLQNRYHIISCDLKDTTNTLNLLSSQIDKSLPTILITECVLCYMTDIDSQNLINTILQEFNSGLWVSYDPIGGAQPNDKFGIIMKRNLWDSRNLDMPTLLDYNSKELYTKRWEQSITDCTTEIKDMWEFLSKEFSTMEKQRIRSLQFLDEIEELKIMQSHYVILNAMWNNR